MLVWFVYATKSQRATAKSHAATLSRDEVTRLYHRAIKSQVWHRSHPYLNLDLDLCLRWVTLSCRVCLANYGQTTSSTKPKVHTVSQRELTQGHRQHAQNVCVKLRVSFLSDASRQTDKQTCLSQYSAVLRREQHKTFKTSRIYLAMLRVVKKLHISDNWPSKKLSTNSENVCDLAFVPDADIWPASGVILLQVSHSSVVTQVT